MNVHSHKPIYVCGYNKTDTNKRLYLKSKTKTFEILVWLSLILSKITNWGHYLLSNRFVGLALTYHCQLL